MNYKLFLQILLILAIISTIFICVKKPQMHKSVLVYNSDFIIAEQESDDYVTEYLPTIEQTTTPSQKSVSTVTYEDYETNYPKTIQTTVKDNRVQTQKVSFTNKSQTPTTTSVQQQTQTVKTPTIQKTGTHVVQVNTPTQKVTINSPQLEQTKITTHAPQTAAQTQKIVNAPTPVINKSATTIPKTITTAPAPIQNTVKTTQAKPEPTQYLTEREEEIAWNIWRSNLQNKIMNDVKLPYVPNGTIFRFSFTVDKYGKVSNVQTRSDDSRYTPYAIQYIAPVIRSYQGRAILNFPKGSRREVTEAKGAWKMSNNTIYSTPQDYNDVERIKN